MITKESRLSLNFALIILLIKLTLDFAYGFFVADLYSYSGMVLKISFYKLLVSYFISLIFIYFLIVFKHKISTFFSFCILLFLYFPIQTYWALGSGDDGFFILVSVGYFLILIFSQATSIRFPLLKQSNFVLYFILTLMIFGYLSIAFLKGAHNLISFDLSAMYENREVLFEQIFHGPFGYLASWVGKVSLPLALGVLLWKRLYSFALIVFFLSLINFGLVQRKEFIMFPLIVCYFYFFEHTRQNSLTKFSMAILLFVSFSISFYLFSGNTFIAGVVFHRLFFVVAQNHFEYYEFFQANPHVYLSNSAFSMFVDYPFSDKVPNLIGYGRFSAGEESFANTGLFASAYMHFGAVGVIIYSIITGLLFSIYNSLIIHGVPRFIVLSIGFISVFQLVNGDLTATILTHGMGLGIILLLLINNTSINNRRVLSN